MLKLGIWPILVAITLPALLVCAVGLALVILVAVLNDSANCRLRRLIMSAGTAFARGRGRATRQ